jgi:sulfate adenylyltransferase
VILSGSKVRAMLENSQAPPREITRPEVAEVLMEGYQALAAK